MDNVLENIPFEQFSCFLSHLIFKELYLNHCLKDAFLQSLIQEKLEEEEEFRAKTAVSAANREKRQKVKEVNDTHNRMAHAANIEDTARPGMGKSLTFNFLEAFVDLNYMKYLKQICSPWYWCLLSSIYLSIQLCLQVCQDSLLNLASMPHFQVKVLHASYLHVFILVTSYGY